GLRDCLHRRGRLAARGGQVELRHVGSALGGHFRSSWRVVARPPAPAAASVGGKAQCWLISRKRSAATCTTCSSRNSSGGCCSATWRNSCSPCALRCNGLLRRGRDAWLCRSLSGASPSPAARCVLPT